MPRHITETRAVTRKVTTAHGKTLLITLAPEGIYVREPRRRTKYLLPYGVAFQRAVDAYVATERLTRRRPRIRRGLL